MTSHFFWVVQIIVLRQRQLATLGVCIIIILNDSLVFRYIPRISPQLSFSDLSCECGLLSLSSVLNIVGREAWYAVIHGVTKVRHDWATELNTDSQDCRRCSHIVLKLLSWVHTMEPCSSDEFFQALNHAEQTFKKMENYLRHKQLCDVILVAGDRRIPAHR